MPQADLQPQWLHYCHRIAGIATSGSRFGPSPAPPQLLRKDKAKNRCRLKACGFMKTPYSVIHWNYIFVRKD